MAIEKCISGGIEAKDDPELEPYVSRRAGSCGSLRVKSPESNVARSQREPPHAKEGWL